MSNSLNKQEDNHHTNYNFDFMMNQVNRANQNPADFWPDQIWLAHL